MPSGGGGPSVAPGGAHTGVPIIKVDPDADDDNIDVIPSLVIRSIMKPRASFNSARDGFRSRDGFRARDNIRSR